MPVLIPFDVSDEQLSFFIDNIDMMLLPGGGTPLSQSAHHNNPKDKVPTPYQVVSSKIIKMIKEKNDKGKYYPLMATCLGLENLFIAENDNNHEILNCNLDDLHKNHTIALNEEGYKNSKFWSKTYTRAEVDNVFNREIVYYTHNCGFTPEDFNKHKTLSKDYHVIGTSKNSKGVEFLASVEHKKYPIIGN